MLPVVGANSEKLVKVVATPGTYICNPTRARTLSGSPTKVKPNENQV